MKRKPVYSLKFHDLRISEFFDLAEILFKGSLTPATAQTLGLGTPYNEMKASYEQLADVFRRNPAMLQTEKLVAAIVRIRRKMMLLKNTLREKLLDAKGERLENAKIINNVAHPYLKDISGDTQSALTANAMEMADALRTAGNLPKLTGLGLEEIVNDIATLAAEANELLLSRGEEKAFQKELGSATGARKILEKQLRFVLYSSIPVHYAEATGALAETFEHTITAINGTLEIFRHLTSGGRNSSGHDGSDKDINSQP